MVRNITLFWFFLLVYQSVSAQAILESTGDGDWEDASTWSAGRIPRGGDIVILRASDAVRVTASAGNPTTLTGDPVRVEVRGTLFFQTGKKIAFPEGSRIDMFNGGSILKGTGGGNSNNIQIGETTVWRAADGDVICPDDCDGFGTFATLPVELFDFSVEPKNQTVLVSWSTRSERDNDFFAVERSQDGITWQTIGIVSGAGTTNQSQYYSYLDFNPATGINYYRLRQQDQDGTQHYSRIESVFLDEAVSLEIYPNPTTRGKTQLKVSELFVITRLQILNYQGKLIWQKDIPSAEGAHLIDLDLSAQPKGLYTLVVQSPSGQHFKRIIYQ